MNTCLITDMMPNETMLIVDCWGTCSRVLSRYSIDPFIGIICGILLIKCSLIMKLVDDSAISWLWWLQYNCSSLASVFIIFPKSWFLWIVIVLMVLSKGKIHYGTLLVACISMCLVVRGNFYAVLNNVQIIASTLN